MSGGPFGHIGREMAELADTAAGERLDAGVPPDAATAAVGDEPGAGESSIGPELVERPGTAIQAEGERCVCGRERHATAGGRCAAGHVWPGSVSPALVTGATSPRFWAAHERERADVRAAILADAGHTPDDAPKALQLAADSVAQAFLIQRSAYLRLVESGGALTSRDRTRRAFVVWQIATDRLERHLRLVGLERRARAVSFTERLAHGIGAKAASTGGEA